MSFTSDTYCCRIAQANKVIASRGREHRHTFSQRVGDTVRAPLTPAMREDGRRARRLGTAEDGRGAGWRASYDELTDRDRRRDTCTQDGGAGDARRAVSKIVKYRGIYTVYFYRPLS